MEHILVLIKKVKTFLIAAKPLVAILIHKDFADVGIAKGERIAILLHLVHLSAAPRHNESTITRSAKQQVSMLIQIGRGNQIMVGSHREIQFVSRETILSIVITEESTTCYQEEAPVVNGIGIDYTIHASNLILFDELDMLAIIAILSDEISMIKLP